MTAGPFLITRDALAVDLRTAPSAAVSPNRIFVKPRSSELVDLLGRLHTRFGARVLVDLPGPKPLQIIRLPKGWSVDEGIRRYKETGLVAFAEPVHQLPSRAEPNDPHFQEGRQWSLRNQGQAAPPQNPDLTCVLGGQFAGGLSGADISATEAWDELTGAPNVVIGIADTGIRHTHEDLADNIWVNPGESGIDDSGNSRSDNGVDDDPTNIPGLDFVDDVRGINALARVDPEEFATTGAENDPADRVGHGTHVAGAAGAVGDNSVGGAGVAWNAQLMDLKIGYPLPFTAPFCVYLEDIDLGDPARITGCADEGAFALALRYAVTGDTHRADIVNFSYGSRVPNEAIRESIELARDAGTLLVVSAGNDGIDIDIEEDYPSGYDLDNIVSVAATNNNDELSNFSSFGARNADLAAPGQSIHGPCHTGDDHYYYRNGSSFAAPMVAGALALIKTRFPTLSHQELVHRLLATTDRLESLAGKVASEGRLNLHRALLPDVLAAYFTASPSILVAPAPVEFTDQSLGAITDWRWDFGDGSAPSSAQNPGHVYADPGEYTVTLTVTGTNNETHQRRRLVTVYSPGDTDGVELDFVAVGDPGNSEDPTSGLGAVDDEYRIGTYEITNAQYAAFLNAVGRSDTSFYDPEMANNKTGGIVRRIGDDGLNVYLVKPHMADKPVERVSYLDALRFINWTYNGQPAGDPGEHTTDAGVYRIVDDTVAENRSALADLFLPTENEWYKAAYFRGGGTDAGYWIYPTQSDTRPVCANAFDIDTPTPGDISNPDDDPASPDGVANYRLSVNNTEGLPACAAIWNNKNGNVTTAGTAGQDSASPYGSFDMGGNVAEFVEGVSAFNRVVTRGGTYDINPNRMRSDQFFEVRADNSYFGTGFRVAAAASTPPEILEHPQDAWAHEPEPAALAVRVRGFPVNYQWQRLDSDNGQWQDLPDETARILRFDPSRPEHAGTYRVVASNAYGQATSAGATVTIRRFLIFSRIGDAGNAYNTADNACGRGAVEQSFDIGTYEITNRQYALFLNSVAAEGDPLALYSTNMENNPRGGIERISGFQDPDRFITRPGMADKPVNFVRRLNALRFINWLHNGRPVGAPGPTTTEDGAYELSPEILAAGTMPARKPGARFFLPNRNEWHKAAYYQANGLAAGYLQYPTRTLGAPLCATAVDLPEEAAGDIANPCMFASTDLFDGCAVANYQDCADWAGLDGNLTTVGSAGPGSASAYGTFDQGGNVAEHVEDESEIALGGSYAGGPVTLTGAHVHIADFPESTVGFRVARAADETGWTPPPTGPVNGQILAGDCGEAFGTEVDLDFDAQGTPHVAYYDSEQGDLRYAVRDNDGGWGSEIVDGAASDAGRFPSIAVGRDGVPRIAYFDATSGVLKFAARRGDNWNVEVIDASDEGRSGLYADLVLDGEDVPHVSFIRETGESGNLLERLVLAINDRLSVDIGDGAERRIEPDKDAGRLTPSPLDPRLQDLRRDPTLVPSVPVPGRRSGVGRGTVMYLTQDGGEWSEPENVDDGKGRAPFRYTSIALNSRGRPLIAYHDTLIGALRVAHKSRLPFLLVERWVNQIADSAGNVGLDPSIAIGPLGVTEISYFDATSGRLKHAREQFLFDIASFRMFSAGFNAVVVDGVGEVGRSASLTFDSSGVGRIAYYDVTGGDLKLATRQSRDDAWSVGFAHTTPRDVGRFTASALFNDVPGIVYHDATNLDLRYTGP